MRDLDGVRRTAEAVANDQSVDILVNNAGLTHREPVWQYAWDAWRTVLDADLSAPFAIAQALCRPMMARGSGKIINIASLQSFQGGTLIAAYAASKHGVVGMTRAMANELAPYGVQVNGIAPGYVETALTQALRDDPERNAAILARIPQGRWGRPEDIAGAALFLASNLSDYVTGHTLVVDGGWLSR